MNNEEVNLTNDDYSSYGLRPKNVDSKEKTIRLLETNFKDSLIPAPSYEGYSYVFPTEIYLITCGI